MNMNQFKTLPIVGIMRDIASDDIEPLVETIIASGLKTVEITMNTNDAPQLINKMIQKSQGQLTIGAGTVLTMDDLSSALNAGATFIVMPVCVSAIVDYCAKKNIPVFPGAFTPQEVYNAWNAGATMVKLFPASIVSAKYIAEIKGPFKNIEILACGGVNAANIKDFFNHQASAVAFGSSIFKKEWIKNKNFEEIKKEIQALISAYNSN